MTDRPQYFDPAGRRSALVNPEAVQIDLPLADLGTRTLAILIDFFVLFMVLYLVTIIGALAIGASVAAGGGPGWLAIVAVLLLSFAVLWGFPVLSETMWHGRTAGKAAVGLRVVTVDGGPVRFRHAALRWLMAFVDFYLFLGIPSIISVLVTKRGQRLGDLAAGTVVIRDRGRNLAAERPVIWQIPPGLMPYAQTLDVSGLDAGDYAMVRSFLLRAASFDDPTRARVAAEVAGAIAWKMRHRPPPGTHPEVLLICTAALVQQRDRTRSGGPGQFRQGSPGAGQPGPGQFGQGQFGQGQFGQGQFGPGQFGPGPVGVFRDPFAPPA